MTPFSECLSLRMMGLRSFPVVISTSIFWLGWTVIQGIGAFCPEYDNVDVIGGETDSWESRLNCPARNAKDKPCLWICCPSEKARSSTNESETLPEIGTRFGGTHDVKTVSQQNFHLSYGDPCGFQWMIPSEYNEFYAVEDGSISVGADFNEGSLYRFGYYCLNRNPESHEYSARVCAPLIRQSNWILFCSVFVILVSSAVFIVYTVIPEQKNFHGLLFRSYMATYTLIGVSMLAVELTTGLRTNPHLYSISEAGVIYFGYSIVFWLNAMSFNIWRSFRKLRSTNVAAGRRQGKMFVWYAIYAWVIPALLVAALMFLIHHLPHLRYQVLGFHTKFAFCVGIVSIVYTCNALLFTMTILAIKSQKRDMIDLVNGVNRHNDHDINEQWFKLHVKLFVLMGGHVVVWVIWLSWPTDIMAHVLATIEVIQGSLLVMIFLWKDNVKQSFWKEVSSWTRPNSVVPSEHP